MPRVLDADPCLLDADPLFTHCNRAQLASAISLVINVCQWLALLRSSFIPLPAGLATYFPRLVTHTLTASGPPDWCGGRVYPQGYCRWATRERPPA